MYIAFTCFLYIYIYIIIMSCMQQEADVYSVGVVMWEVWGGCEPWQGLHGRGLHHALVEKKMSLPLGEEHRDIARLLRLTFSPQPEHRPSARQASDSGSNVMKSIITIIIIIMQYFLLPTFVVSHDNL